MTISTAVARHTATPILRANGTIAAECPICHTIGTTFRPEPGTMIWQKCPRRDCGQMYACYVWPHWRQLVQGPPIDADGAGG